MTRLMLWTLLLALVLILGGVIAQMMIQDPGVMMLTWKGWVVETTFWTGIALILTTCVMVIFLVALFRRFAPHRLLASYRNRRDQKVAKKETAIAIDSWLHGSEDRALQALQRVANAGGSDRLPHAVSLAVGLTHADWLERMGRFLTQEPELQLFAQALQAERCWQMGQNEEFLALLQQHPKLMHVSWLRERSWQAMLASERALDLVKIVNEAPNIQPEQRQQWLAKAVTAALKQNHGTPGVGNPILKTLSKTQRQSAEIVSAEVAYLISVADHEQAFKRVKQLLTTPNHRELCNLLMDIDVEPSRKLTLLENMPAAESGPVYCRVAGSVNLQLQLWGQAQAWLEQGWAQQDQHCGLLLANLFEQRNMPDQAAKLYRTLATGRPAIR